MNKKADENEHLKKKAGQAYLSNHSSEVLARMPKRVLRHCAKAVRVRLISQDQNPVILYDHSANEPRLAQVNNTPQQYKALYALAKGKWGEATPGSDLYNRQGEKVGQVIDADWEAVDKEGRAFGCKSCGTSFNTLASAYNHEAHLLGVCNYAEFVEDDFKKTVKPPSTFQDKLYFANSEGCFDFEDESNRKYIPEPLYDEIREVFLPGYTSNNLKKSGIQRLNRVRKEEAVIVLKPENNTGNTPVLYRLQDDYADTNKRIFLREHPQYEPDPYGALTLDGHKTDFIPDNYSHYLFDRDGHRVGTQVKDASTLPDSLFGLKTAAAV